MLPFFTTPACAERLRAVAASWLGTPFYPHATVKGRGCSCESLTLCIGLECGWLNIGKADFPRGSIRHWRAHRTSLIVPFIENQLAGVLQSISAPFLPGDVIWFTDAACEHLGTVIDDRQFIHCVHPEGVQLSRHDDATFAKRIARAWRPVV